MWTWRSRRVWLPPAISPEEHADRLRRAEREARNAVKLRDQPNVVTVHDVVIDSDIPWIIMQLVDGVSLDEHVLEHGPVLAQRAVDIARALLRALGAAHAAGVVHRDVKPGNVLLAATGEVLLTDFGIAVHETDTALTATGALVGSMEYIAPERWENRRVDGASDLFSLGATLYQAVEGNSPFRRDTAAATLAAVLNHQVPRSTRAGAPLAGLIEKLLAKDPTQRSTVTEALTLLDTLPDTDATTITQPPKRRQTRIMTTTGRRRVLHNSTPPTEAARVGATLILAAIIAVAVYGITQVANGHADYFVHDLGETIVFCGLWSGVFAATLVGDLTKGCLLDGVLFLIGGAAGTFAFAGVMPFVVQVLPTIGIALGWAEIPSIAIIFGVAMGGTAMLDKSKKA